MDGLGLGLSQSLTLYIVARSQSKWSSKWLVHFAMLLRSFYEKPPGVVSAFALLLPALPSPQSQLSSNKRASKQTRLAGSIHSPQHELH